MRSFIVFLALVSFLGIAKAAEPILGWEAYGAVRFGSRLADIEKQLGEKAKAETGEQGCDFVQFKKYPKASFMVEKGIITRADVDEGVTNTLKISVGTPLAAVKQKYPKVYIAPHHYDENGFYLIFKNQSGKKAIVMEVGENRVAYIRGGLEPSVEYVEGCL